jgi:hypothetical protein
MELIYTYLCGGINGLNDADAKNWRETSKSLLMTATLDPMRRDYRGIEDQSVEAIVQGDLEDIAASRFVLINATRPSWGTAMEIVYAYTAGNNRIVAFTEGAKISPWLSFHSDAIYNTVEEAIADINTHAFNHLSPEAAIAQLKMNKVAA